MGLDSLIIETESWMGELNLLIIDVEFCYEII